MIKNDRLRNWAVGLCDRMLTGCVDREIRDGAKNARERLKNAPVKILLDNAVIRNVAYLFSNPVYEQEVDFPSKENRWKLPVRSMVPVYVSPSEKRMEENLKFLPSILCLAREGYVELFVSSALEAERETQSVFGYNSSSPWGYHLFFDSDVSIRGLEQDDAYEWQDGIVSSWEHYLKKFQAEERKGRKDDFDKLSLRQQRLQDWIDKKKENDSEFDNFVKSIWGNVTNKKKLRDYWHVYTADKHGMDYFLTVDFRLSDHIENQHKNEVVRNLETKVVTPSKLGEIWGKKSMRDRTFRFLYKNTILRDVRHGWHGAVDYGPFGPGRIEKVDG